MRAVAADGCCHPDYGARRVANACVLLVLALAAAGCAASRSYVDAEGPRFAGSFAAAETSGACGAPDGQLTVVSFNIQFGERLDRALEVLTGNAWTRDADILLLQEMDSPGVARMAEALSLHYAFFPSGVHPASRRDFGTAILSRWPLSDLRKIVLPHGAYGIGLRRVVTVASLSCAGRTIRVYSVHLSSPPALLSAERREQIERIIQDAAGAGVAIVGGDFNSSGVGRMFAAGGFAWLTRGLPGTSRGLGHWFSFDHVFVKGAGVPERDAAGFLESQGASDHRLVWARVVLPR